MKKMNYEELQNYCEEQYREVKETGITKEINEFREDIYYTLARAKYDHKMNVKDKSLYKLYIDSLNQDIFGLDILLQNLYYYETNYDFISEFELMKYELQINDLYEFAQNAVDEVFKILNELK